MQRLIFFVLTAWAAMWLIKRLLRGGSRRRRPIRPPEAPRQIEMIACRLCGSYVPENEAVRDARGHGYCCDQHRSIAAEQDR